jgi:hypothetical protein
MDENIMNEGDTVFRSQFERANRMKRADDASVSRVEEDDENGWMNVRVGDLRWAATRDLPGRFADASHQGRIENAPPAGTTPTHDRVSYSDPLPDYLDPTDPGAPA